MFLVKREESRSFNVFLGVFCVFLVFGRERKRVEKLEKEQKIRRKKNVVSPLSKVCIGLFIAPALAALLGLLASKDL